MIAQIRSLKARVVTCTFGTIGSASQRMGWIVAVKLSKFGQQHIYGLAPGLKPSTGTCDKQASLLLFSMTRDLRRQKSGSHGMDKIRAMFGWIGMQPPWRHGSKTMVVLCISGITT